MFMPIPFPNMGGPSICIQTGETLQIIHRKYFRNKDYTQNMLGLWWLKGIIFNKRATQTRVCKFVGEKA